MAFLKLALFALLTAPAVLGARRLRGNFERNERSLTNTFPFNQNSGAEEHHEHHEDHHGHHEASELATRDNRQGADVDVSFPAVAAAGPGSDGKRCIDKVEMVEETEYDDVVQCDHSYDRRCHTTYTTSYESQQVEECEEDDESNFNSSDDFDDSSEEDEEEGEDHVGEMRPLVEEEECEDTPNTRHVSVDLPAETHESEACSETLDGGDESHASIVSAPQNVKEQRRSQVIAGIGVHVGYVRYDWLDY